MPIATAVAGIQVRGSRRRRATSHWPVPMTAPATKPPTSAEATSLTRPVTAVARTPAMGKATKPTVHSSQALVLKRCWFSTRPSPSLYDVLDTVQHSDGTLFKSQGNLGRLGGHMAGDTNSQTRPRGSLTREEIIKEALALLEEHGPVALSMRRL